MGIFTGMMLLYIMAQIFSFLMEGESGIATTQLTAAISKTERYVPIASGEGFLSADTRVFIQDEEIEYFSIQTTAISTCTVPPCMDTQTTGRGFNDTDAKGHAAGAKVYNVTSGLINQAVGFRVGNTETLIGKLTFPFLAGWALVKFMGSAVMWDYQFLDGNGVYFKYFMYAFSFAMVLRAILVLRSGGGFPP